jgi:hypothetical protein
VTHRKDARTEPGLKIKFNADLTLAASLQHLHELGSTPRRGSHSLPLYEPQRVEKSPLAPQLVRVAIATCAAWIDHSHS